MDKFNLFRMVETHIKEVAKECDVSEEFVIKEWAAFIKEAKNNVEKGNGNERD
ncbi:hypothetical protein [Bacillus thuringiensis]|uniref:hypothetical protein n=1 Tax=Bacillus thuringiensis TaxID=1428 RepID=UPI00159BC712|nr:hypothetical protein [Bacillus thuringiensis]